jgi:hypothetical protein
MTIKCSETGNWDGVGGLCMPEPWRHYDMAERKFKGPDCEILSMIADYCVDDGFVALFILSHDLEPIFIGKIDIDDDSDIEAIADQIAPGPKDWGSAPTETAANTVFKKFQIDDFILMVDVSNVSNRFMTNCCPE